MATTITTDEKQFTVVFSATAKKSMKAMKAMKAANKSNNKKVTITSKGDIVRQRA